MNQSVKWQHIGVLYQNQGVPRKGDRRAQQIVENATEFIAKAGYENLDFVKLAKKCKITRPLINHYFPEKEQLLLAVVSFVAVEHQKFLLEQIPENQKSMKEVLRSYILANLEWPRKKNAHAKVWMHYLALAAYQESERMENTRSVDHGAKRIEEILKQGILQEEWGGFEASWKAKSLQLLITGAVISLITEVRSESEYASIVEQSLKECGVMLDVSF